MRQNWAAVVSGSDRKVILPQYMAARPRYLAAERPVLRELRLIRDRPPNYDPNTHIEIWPDGVARKVDGRLVVNFDEVPFTINWATKQLVAKGERISLCRSALNQLKKYRTGTIGIFMTVEEILLVVLLYRKTGGPNVRHRLHKLGQTDESQLLVLGSDTGTMDGTTWPLCLEALATVTKERRGVVDETGSDWKYALALYVDNYSVHCNKAVSDDMALRHGIYIRLLLRNCSHIQQPVDRNIGIAFKNMYRALMLEWAFDLQTMETVGSLPDVGGPKFIEMSIGVVNTVFIAVCVRPII